MSHLFEQNLFMIGDVTYRNFLRGAVKNWSPHSYFAMMKNGGCDLLGNIEGSSNFSPTFEHRNFSLSNNNKNILGGMTQRGMYEWRVSSFIGLCRLSEQALPIIGDIFCIVAFYVGPWRIGHLTHALPWWKMVDANLLEPLKDFQIFSQVLSIEIFTFQQ